MPPTSRDCSFIFGSCKRIIIGLTGKTGSGCSTVAQKIEELGSNLANAPASLPIRGNPDERAHAIVHNYLRTQCRPKVQVVSVTDIITDFLLTAPSGYENLRNFINETKHIVKREELLPKLDGIKDCFAQDRSMIVISEATRKVKEVLVGYRLNFRQNNRKQANCYTYVYQELGNTLRGTGSASLRTGDWKPSRSEEHLNTLAKTIASSIDGIQDEPNEGRNGFIQRPTIVVVDAIRNPFEAVFLSRRFANFYLVAVNKPEQQRIRGLKRKGLMTVEIEDIDNQECPDGAMDASNYHRVNISKCEEMADIYLVNDADENDGAADALDRQIVKYLALMLKPGIVSPTKLETCMQVANTVKLNSGCLSRQVGAVVTDRDCNILSVGWNTTPGNQIPCNLRSAYDVVAKTDLSAFSQYECENEGFRSHVALKLLVHRRGCNEESECGAGHEQDQFFPYCFKDVYNGIKKNKNQVHTRSIHAEEMAFLNKTASCRDGILFTTSSPCELCAKKARHEGIGRVYYLVAYRGIADDHILKGAEPELRMELFRGVTGGAFSKLYAPLIAQKDEQYMRDGFRFTDKLEGIWIKSVALTADKEGQYLRVVDVDDNGKYAVQLGASGSKFTLEDEEQKLSIQYTLEKELAPRPNEGPCPLCGADSEEGRDTCEICGHSNDLAKKGIVYLCADLCDPSGKTRIKANRMHKYAWEKFRLKFLDERKFVLQSMANDYFVRACDDGHLVADVETCNVDAPRTGCIFEIEFPCEG